MLLPCALVLLALAALAARRLSRGRLWRLHKQMQVSFRSIPLLGHAYKFLGTNEDRMRMFDELARQAYANKHGMVSFWLAHYLCISISDPVVASTVLRTFSDKWPVTLPMRHLLGNGSIFGEEKIWRVRRKILVHVFNSKYCDNFVKVFERNNKILTEKLSSVVDTGEFSMWEYFSAYTLDSAFDITFGENLNVQRNPSHPFAQAFQDYFRNCAARVCQPWLFSGALYELLPVAARQRRNRRAVWECIEDMIKKKKMSAKEQIGKETEGDSQKVKSDKSFLDLLIEFSGGEDGYSATELREECLVLILAATDSSATAAAFAAVLLANHPHVQHTLYQEIQEVLGDSERSLENLAKLKYLDAVVKETLRLYPPALITVRRCDKELKLPSGLTFDDGCYFLLNIWGIHRNPAHWGADAAQFRPERFLSATPDQLAAFLPFGRGPRSCTGLSLAMTSIKLSLAELVRHFRLAPALSYTCSAREPLRVAFDILLKHVDKFKVQLTRRH